ncbi:MAG: type II secretion system protein N [Sphingobium sp.]
MRWLSRRTGIALSVIFLVALVVFLPMRAALSIAGLERWGASAREVRGTIWSGQIYQFMLGDIALGSVDGGLSPIQLLMGRARLDVKRRTGAADDIAGALTIGLGRIGIDDVTGAVPLGRSLAPLPLSRLQMDDVTAWFAGERCGHAAGRVRARVSGGLPGLNLSQGLSGSIACDRDAIVLPLVSQSGMESISLRILRSGRYAAEMRVQTADDALAGALGQAGFTRAGDALLLKVEGSL